MKIYLNQLSVHHFRNYENVSLQLTSLPIVLTGPNGAGKTNLLEAISMFSAGTGFRGAHILDLSKEDSAASDIRVPWAVHARLSSEVSLGTGVSFDALGRAHRVYKVQGEVVKHVGCFYDYLSLISITPDMDHLFTEPAVTRRHFIDRLISSYDAMYAEHLRAYEKAMKQRLTILKKEKEWDLLWLDSLEKIMSEKNVIITKTRYQLTQRLLEGQQSQIPLFPRFHNEMAGEIDAFIHRYSADETEALIQQKLKERRNTDRLSGMTTVGCHRSDWLVTHLGNNRLAKECSTGEQKIMLISVILAFVYQKIKNSDILLVLLLDDVIARLDLHHRMVLFEQIEELNRTCDEMASVQTFFSGTDTALFADMKNKQIFDVNNAIITEL